MLSVMPTVMYAECRKLALTLSVVMLSVIMLSVIMPSVNMLNVVAPVKFDAY